MSNSAPIVHHSFRKFRQSVDFHQMCSRSKLVMAWTEKTNNRQVSTFWCRIKFRLTNSEILNRTRNSKGADGHATSACIQTIIFKWKQHRYTSYIYVHLNSVSFVAWWTLHVGPLQWPLLPELLTLWCKLLHSPHGSIGTESNRILDGETWGGCLGRLEIIYWHNVKNYA